MSSQKPQVHFLSLPLEARLYIYKNILICQPQVVTHWRPVGINASILRTCKQVHSEASPILYSENSFLVANPEGILQWLKQIGPVNTKLLKRVCIVVDAVWSTVARPSTRDRPRGGSRWYKLLNRLAQEATGLRHIYMYWEAQDTCGDYGAGADVRFVRELVKIRGLQSVVINGFYGKQWPKYMTEKMGVAVQEAGRGPAMWQSLRKYQQRTEGIIP